MKTLNNLGYFSGDDIFLLCIIAWGILEGSLFVCPL